MKDLGRRRVEVAKPLFEKTWTLPDIVAMK
jgi:hypothetical protein